MAGDPPLDAAETKAALVAVRCWRERRTEADVRCPRCGAGGLVVVDYSVRPWREWYVLACASCGLDQTLAVPSAPPPSD